MQLPGAHMQISFLKDLATPRNPRSKFTFINYLHSVGRLNNFINLGTFLPSRREYEDYLRWCASHFEADGIVRYGAEVVEVVPAAKGVDGKVTLFRVISKDIKTGVLSSRIARHVVVAVGGLPAIPAAFPQNHPAVIHSSKYSYSVPRALPTSQEPYNIAVIGSGQSAAEIFWDLPSRFPNAKITLFIKSAALKPSDDSPFVNEIFDPERVDGFYGTTEHERSLAVREDRSTNYGVVREELLNRLYERLYAQRLDTPVVAERKIGIVANTCVVGTRTVRVDGKEKLALQLHTPQKPTASASTTTSSREVVVDAVFVATGYIRNAHETMLAKTKDLVSPIARERGQTIFPVGRDYRVAFDGAKVDENAGVWLQGCNEKTHGVSSITLFSLTLCLLHGSPTKTPSPPQD